MYTVIKNFWSNINKDKLDKYITIISLIVFVCLSLYQVLNHVPFFDETNAWNIAANLSFSEIFQITRHEGHLFVWYFLIKPFAYYNIAYPYSMLFLNWFIMLGVVALLWRFAPFNSITKMFITFSLLIRTFYLHARCYSIGILFLVLLCVLYKNRLKHPYLYALLLVLAANTSVMAAILAFSLGVCFLFDLRKGLSEKCLIKKEVFLTLGICLSGVILVLAQLYNFVVPYYSNATYDYSKHLTFFYFRDYDNILPFMLLFCHLWLLLFAWKFFKKTKLPFVFLMLSTYILLVLFLGVYRASFWHFMFLFLAIIIALWIYMSEYKFEDVFQKRYLAIFTLMFVTLTFYPYKAEVSGAHIPMLEYLKENKQTYVNHKIFLYPTDSSVIGIVPSLRDDNFKFYNCLGESYNSVDLYKHQWNKPVVNFDKISKKLKSGEKAYIFVSIAFPHEKTNNKFKKCVTIYKYKNNELKIKLLQRKTNVYIWEVVKK